MKEQKDVKTFRVIWYCVASSFMSLLRDAYTSTVALFKNEFRMSLYRSSLSQNDLFSISYL